MFANLRDDGSFAVLERNFTSCGSSRRVRIRLIDVIRIRGELGRGWRQYAARIHPSEVSTIVREFVGGSGYCAVGVS